jgi:hypothetical protein
MLIKNEISFDATAEVKDGGPTGPKVRLDRLPSTLNWEEQESYSEGRCTTYTLGASHDGYYYEARLYVEDLQYSGYGWPMKMSDDAADILNKIIAEFVYEEDPAIQPRLIPEQP